MKEYIDESEYDKYDYVPVYHKHKKCPKCSGQLELSRYFACLGCIPTLSDDPGDFIYNVENF